MDELSVSLLNWSFIRVTGDRGLLQELSDHFTFYIKNYKHMPTYRNGMWDGQIRLFDMQYNKLPSGLFVKLIKFCKNNDIKLHYNKNMRVMLPKPLEKSVTDILDGYSIPFDPYEHQVKAIEKMLVDRRLLVLSATSCHAKNDKIIMHDLSIKNIQDIIVGDFVMGVDGLPKEVLKTYTGETNLYDIKPKNNRPSITVTGNHILPLTYTNTGRPAHENDIEISVDSYLEQHDYFKHITKLKYNQSELLSNIKTNFKLTPYFIGCYLGDGSTHSCVMTNIDDEIIKETYSQAEILGMKVKSNDSLHYRMVGITSKRNKVFHEFEKMGIIFGKTPTHKHISCGERFIPNHVFTESIEYRYEVLAGIIDSDRTNANNTGYDLIFKSNKFRDDVIRLATSLGMVCSHSIKLVNGVPYFRCLIQGDVYKIPVRIERKKITEKNKRCNSYISGFDIIPKGVDEYYGIMCADHKYLHESGMHVHNSGKSLNIYAVIRYLSEIGKRTLVIVPTTSLVEQLYQDCDDYGWAIHKYANKIHSGNGKNEVIVRINDQLTFLGEDWVDLANGKRKKAKSIKKTDEISDDYLTETIS